MSLSALWHTSCRHDNRRGLSLSKKKLRLSRARSSASNACIDAWNNQSFPRLLVTAIMKSFPFQKRTRVGNWEGISIEVLDADVAYSHRSVNSSLDGSLIFSLSSASLSRSVFCSMLATSFLVPTTTSGLTLMLSMPCRTRNSVNSG